MERKNNKKRTNGRNYNFTQVEKIVSFIVKPKFIDGQKPINFFKSIPCEIPKFNQPKNILGQKLSTNALKNLRLKHVLLHISKDEDKAYSIAQKQKFECIVLKNVIRTSHKTFIN